MDEVMDEQTDWRMKSHYILQDLIPFEAAAQKEKEENGDPECRKEKYRT